VRYRSRASAFQWTGSAPGWPPCRPIDQPGARRRRAWRPVVAAVVPPWAGSTGRTLPHQATHARAVPALDLVCRRGRVLDHVVQDRGGQHQRIVHTRHVCQQVHRLEGVVDGRRTVRVLAPLVAVLHRCKQDRVEHQGPARKTQCHHRPLCMARNRTDVPARTRASRRAPPPLRRLG
jgi:hypothetical protein